jgi:hypothetical protein
MNILQGETSCKSMNISILCPRYPQGGGGTPGKESRRKQKTKYNSRSLGDDKQESKTKTKAKAEVQHARVEDLASRSGSVKGV